MFPRWHILLGAVFIAALWIFIPKIPFFYLTLVFFASFLIDFDHYVVASFKTKKLGLKNSLKYHKIKCKEELEEISQGIRRKGDFHLFHTVEFHALVGILGFLWVGFFYIFIGLIFHSLVDTFFFLFTGVFHRREYFFFNWTRKRRN